MSKAEKAVNFTTLWAARLGLTVLAVAGTMHLLAGIDPMVAWPVTVALVALLVKETL